MPTKSEKFNPNYLPARKDHERAVDNTAFYNSWPWRKVSKAYRAVNPTCELYCKDRGVVGPADICDHKVQLQEVLAKGEDPYAWENLQSVCKRCHAIKSGKESKKVKI